MDTEVYKIRIDQLMLMKHLDDEKAADGNASLIDGLKSELGHIDDEMHEIPDGIIDAFVEKIIVYDEGFEKNDTYMK